MLGAGGYVAGPVGLSAVLRRMPVVLMEADSHLGLANRMLAPAARRVCLAFPIEGRDGAKYLVTGRPVPPPATDRAAARERFGIGGNEMCVLVFGGSLGARSINYAALEAFAGARFRVLHAAGERDLPGMQSPGPHYDLRGYIADFGEALLASDLVVARSGGSVFEIAAAGRPAVLIPYPYATADHQAANARYMEQAGAAVVIPDSELTGAAARGRGRPAAGGPGEAGGDGACLPVPGEARGGARHRRRAVDCGARALTQNGLLGKLGPSRSLACAARSIARAAQNVPEGGPPLHEPPLLPGGEDHRNASTCE